MTRTAPPRLPRRTRTTSEFAHPATGRGYLLPSEASALLRLSECSLGATGADWEGDDDRDRTLFAHRGRAL